MEERERVDPVEDRDATLSEPKPAAAGGQSNWRARLRQAGEATRAVGAVAATKAVEIGSDAVDKGKQLGAQTGARLEDAGLKESAGQLGSTVKRNGSQALQRVTVASKKVGQEARTSVGAVTPASRYAPERVSEDTKVRGAPHVWALWAVGGWAGVHRLVDSDNRNPAWRRLAFAATVVTAVVVLLIIVTQLVGSTPGVLLRAFVVDLMFGRVDSWSEAVAEFRSNSQRHALRAALLTGAIALSILALMLVWLSEAYWVAKWTRQRKRDNQARKDASLRQQRENAIAPTSGADAESDREPGVPAQLSPTDTPRPSTPPGPT